LLKANWKNKKTPLLSVPIMLFISDFWETFVNLGSKVVTLNFYSMSSSFVTDTSEQKADSSVVIVLSDDGTLCLDEQTLQKLFGAIQQKFKTHYKYLTMYI
jgi:hypothetical protein